MDREGFIKFFLSFSEKRKANTVRTIGSARREIDEGNSSFCEWLIKEFRSQSELGFRGRCASVAEHHASNRRRLDEICQGHLIANESYFCDLDTQDIEAGVLGECTLEAYLFESQRTNDDSRCALHHREESGQGGCFRVPRTGGEER